MQLSKIPADTAGQKALIKDLLSGKKVVADLVEDSLEIRMNLTPSDQERESFRVNLDRQDNLQGDGNTTYFTVDMPAIEKTAFEPGYLQALEQSPIDKAAPAIQPQPAYQTTPKPVSDSYWNFGSGGGDRLDRVAKALNNSI